MSGARFEVAVVGAGIIGSACALELARAGRSVVVLESVGIASDTSCRAMGHVGVYDDSPAQMALSRYGVQCWQDIAPDLPPEVDYVERGSLWLASREEEMADVEAKSRTYSDFGVEARPIDSSQLSGLEPNLRPGLPGALHVPGDIVLDAAEATRFIAESARSFGAEFRIGAKVRALTERGPRLEGGELVSADQTVLATGWRAPELVPTLPVRPRKGHIVQLTPPKGYIRHQLSEISYVRGAEPTADDVISFSLQPRSSGRCLLGATRQYVGSSTVVDPSVVERLVARAAEFLPDIGRQPVERTWAGLRPAGQNALPVIGPLRDGGWLLVAVAHEGIGITTSIATGRIVRDLILRQRPTIDPGPFLPGPEIRAPR